MIVDFSAYAEALIVKHSFPCCSKFFSYTFEKGFVDRFSKITALSPAAISGKK